ncbi:MAG: phosphate ABC transporter permease subunit PstC [Armatimonadota bacterium]|nr:phosphate ABC transporter permease subunit PstC [Armatimonadota bacterium]
MVKKRRRILEDFIERLIQLCGIAAIIFVVLIFGLLLRNGAPIFKYTSIGKFLFGREWLPLSGRFEILPLILGSLVVTAGAIIIAVPLGVAVAVYIAEIASPRMKDLLKPVIETLAAIPSVVIGFIGLLVVAPAVKTLFNLPTGLTAFTGAIMLAFMSLPTIISISEDALTAVSVEYRAASLALGATKWQTIRRIVVPSARSGILAAVMLGIGRVIGETMAVLMVTGNAAIIPHSIFQPVRTMTATIAAEMGETVQYSPHYFALFAIGLVLFLITFLINLIADLALRRRETTR